MKRFTVIAMVLAMVLTVAAGAYAAELKVRGQVQTWATGTDNWDFTASKSTTATGLTKTTSPSRTVLVCSLTSSPMRT